MLCSLKELANRHQLQQLQVRAHRHRLSTKLSFSSAKTWSVCRLPGRRLYEVRARSWPCRPLCSRLSLSFRPASGRSGRQQGLRRI